MGLVLKLAKVADDAGRALRLARFAMIASVQDQPMVGMQLKIRRNIVFDGAFYRVDILARCNAGPVAHAKDMGVHSLRRLAPPHVQHHICGLAANPGQGLQGRA